MLVLDTLQSCENGLSCSDFPADSGVIPVEMAGLLFLYVGPDQMMPVASALATVLGVIMIFWNRVVGLVRRVFGRFKTADSGGSSPAASSTSEPPPH
jgi:hypothetical protein